MIYEEAKSIADKVVALLEPHCHRIAIAGSIRREKAECRDIEIVCIPKRFKVGNGEVPIQEFVDLVRSWEKVKGEPFGKYTQRILPEGIKLDLFMANELNWGLQFAIRTGSADYSFKVLATGWARKGYTSKEGMLYKADGSVTHIREEKELFDLLGLDYIHPKFRNL